MTAHPPAPQGAPTPQGPPWDIGELLRAGLTALKANWAVLILAPASAFLVAALPLGLGLGIGTIALRDGNTALFVITATLGALGTAGLWPFALAGVVRVMVAAARGERPAFKVVMTGADRAVPLFLTSLIMFAMVEVGLVLGVVPGVILAIGLFFAPYYVVEQRLEPLDALQASWEATAGRRVELFVFHVVASVVVGLASIACGVGALVALPIVLVSYAAIYLRLAHAAGVVNPAGPRLPGSLRPPPPR